MQQNRLEFSKKNRQDNTAKGVQIMNLQDYMIQLGAKKSSISGDNPHLLLTLASRNKKDRFPSDLAVFDDEPTMLYVLRHKTSRVHIISNKDVQDNFNNLHTYCKVEYNYIIQKLQANEIDFIFNEQSY